MDSTHHEEQRDEEPEAECLQPMLHFLVMLGAIAGFFCRVTDQERSRDHASASASIRVAKVVVKTARAASSTKGTSGS